MTLSTGSHILKEGSKVILTTSPALSIRGSGVENGTLELPSTQEYEDVKFNLWVFADVALDGNNEDAKYEVKSFVMFCGRRNAWMLGTISLKVFHKEALQITNIE